MSSTVKKPLSARKQKRKDMQKANPFTKLSEKDPEFFEFLKQNDEDLLDFDIQDDSELDPEIIQDSEDEEPKETKKTLTKKNKKESKKSKHVVDQDIDDNFTFSENTNQVQVEPENKYPDEIENMEEDDSNEEDNNEEDDEDLDDEDLDDEDLDEEDNEDDDEDDDENEEEDDDEDDEAAARHLLRKVRISEETLEDWGERLRENPDKKLLTEVISAFRIAVKCISGKSSKIRAEAATHFNAIFKLVLLDMQPAFMHLLKLTSKPDEPLRPKKSTFWKKYVTLIKAYLGSLLDVLDSITNSQILATLMKHMLTLVPFYLCFVPLVKRLLKQVSTFWSEGEEQVRVLSFLIILRMLRDQKSEMIGYIMKKLYMAYVKNCKFTDVHNVAMIQFMKQSLVELYSLDQGVAYQHAFIFIRQCAITLRSAMMSDKKEGFKSVYNWQYVHSLLLWAQTISCLHPSDILRPLIFPLVQVIQGTIKLIPSSRYVPLRVQLISALIKVSSSTNVFIPIMPLIMELLDILNRSPKYKVVNNKKKTNFDVLLKVQAEFIHTTEFAELCIQNTYKLALEYSASQSYSIAFPELAQGALHRLRKFIKGWKNPQECRTLKQLADKIQESAKFIEDRRQSINFNISEKENVEAWEKDIQLTGTPLTKYFEQWKKVTSKK